MILSSDFQYVAFIILFLLGLLCGFCRDVCNAILLIFKNKLFAKNVLDFLFCLVFGLVFFLGLNFYNYGQFRIYLFLAYLTAFVLQRKMFGKLFAKLFLLVYNKTIKLLNKFKRTPVGVFLFK